MHPKIFGLGMKNVFIIASKKILKTCNRMPKKAIIGMRGCYQTERRRALEDTIIVDLYLARDEKAIYRTDEKYGSRLRACR